MDYCISDFLLHKYKIPRITTTKGMIPKTQSIFPHFRQFLKSNSHFTRRLRPLKSSWTGQALAFTLWMWSIAEFTERLNWVARRYKFLNYNQTVCTSVILQYEMLQPHNSPKEKKPPSSGVHQIESTLNTSRITVSELIQLRTSKWEQNVLAH